MTDTTNPANLEGEEFHDWIASHLAYRQDWSRLLVHEHLQRTRDSVDGLLQVLNDQLEEYGGSDKDWTRRTTGMKKMAEGRMRQLNRHAEGTGPGISGWKKFADTLVGLIIESGDDALVDMLDDVMIPVGGLNAGDWWDRRRDKREEARVTAIANGRVDEFMVTGRDAA